VKRTYGRTEPPGNACIRYSFREREREREREDSNDDACTDRSPRGVASLKLNETFVFLGRWFHLGLVVDRHTQTQLASNRRGNLGPQAAAARYDISHEEFVAPGVNLRGDDIYAGRVACTCRSIG
jgi:hypothetical protein